MLDKKSKAVLKKLYRAKHLPLAKARRIPGCRMDSEADAVLARLCDHRLIARHCSGVNPETRTAIYDGYEITLDGAALIEQKRRDFFMFVIPYSITTLIAILSLLTTIAANWNTIRSWFLE